MSIAADSTAAIDATGIATIVLALVTAVSVLVALYVARKAARDATDARNAQTFLQYYQNYFRSQRGDRARDLIKKGFVDEPSAEDREIIREAYGYYELLAIFIDEGLIDERLAYKMFSGALRLAAENFDAWYKVHSQNAGLPPALYAVHLRTMVKRWGGLTDEDAMPDGLLTKPFPRARGRPPAKA